jgi:hypothetical protein
VYYWVTPQWYYNEAKQSGVFEVLGLGPDVREVVATVSLEMVEQSAVDLIGDLSGNAPPPSTGGIHDVAAYIRSFTASVSTSKDKLVAWILATFQTRMETSSEDGSVRMNAGPVSTFMDKFTKWIRELVVRITAKGSNEGAGESSSLSSLPEAILKGTSVTQSSHQ